MWRHIRKTVIFSVKFLCLPPFSFLAIKFPLTGYYFILVSALNSKTGFCITHIPFQIGFTVCTWLNLCDTWRRKYRCAEILPPWWAFCVSDSTDINWLPSHGIFPTKYRGLAQLKREQDVWYRLIGSYIYSADHRPISVSEPRGHDRKIEEDNFVK
jgi:hypothetical protein